VKEKERERREGERLRDGFGWTDAPEANASVGVTQKMFTIMSALLRSHSKQRSILKRKTNSAVFGSSNIELTQRTYTTRVDIRSAVLYVH